MALKALHGVLLASYATVRIPIGIVSQQLSQTHGESVTRLEAIYGITKNARDDFQMMTTAFSELSSTVSTTTGAPASISDSRQAPQWGCHIHEDLENAFRDSRPF